MLMEEFANPSPVSGTHTNVYGLPFTGMAPAALATAVAVGTDVATGALPEGLLRAQLRLP